MESTKILLGEKRHKLGVNEDNFIDVELQSYEKVIPNTEDTFNIDAYNQYFKEKDESNKYRLAFTITPFCSNVLFNVLTEPVYKEGSNDCRTITSISGTSIEGFERYKAITSGYTRAHLVRDTGFSHPKTNRYGEPITYHCGYDIFSNHFLRKKEFNVVNSAKTIDADFNTLSDYLRDNTGEITKEKILQIKKGVIDSEETPIHLYQYDTVMSYSDAILENLIETNGWFGFLNPTTLPINNLTGGDGEKYSVNKCMNKNKAWEQIDMYPDRSLFSFVPRINKFRGRTEKNWDYCITYPFASDIRNDFVQNQDTGVNGLKCKMITEINYTYLENEGAMVTFKSFLRHNLTPGGYVILSFVESGSKERKTANPVKVEGVGYNGADPEHYFSVRLSAIINEVGRFGNSSVDTKLVSLMSPGDFEEIRFKKFVNGGEARYYLRIFKKFEGKTSSLNKLSFSQNIYSDQVAQIVYTDDFDTSGKVDNLGRPISELFLTIVKRNAGYKEWYEDGDYGNEVVEFSHCFGEVTSGFDMPTDDECRDYNVRRIHSIDAISAGKRIITPSPDKLETGITIETGGVKIDGNESGVTFYGDIDESGVTFYGDIVEFIPAIMQETVIADVYHRFNTAQREVSDPTKEPEEEPYGELYFDEFKHDDYDIDEEFEVSSGETLVSGQKVNLVPEGYYYKPHYRVMIRQFEGTVNQGEHKEIAYSSIVNAGGGNWDIVTSKNYYFEAPYSVYRDSDGGIHTPEEEHAGMEELPIRDGSKVYACKNYDGKISTITGTCISVGGADFREITLHFDSNANIKKDGWKIFRENTEKPEYAFELEDGTGRYLWRNVMSYSDMSPDDELYDDLFTNGAHYFHKNIMFYVKRQDPNGEYGIGNEPGDLAEFVSIKGKQKDVSYPEFFEEGTKDIC